MFFFALFFFFYEPSSTEIYALSLHDALPILCIPVAMGVVLIFWRARRNLLEISRQNFGWARRRDRKSTRLNSSHRCISYAVFCLKKKTNNWSIQRAHHTSIEHNGNRRTRRDV